MSAALSPRAARIAELLRLADGRLGSAASGLARTDASAAVLVGAARRQIAEALGVLTADPEPVS